ncbi:Gfo/Idh/MocA family oxidoreductase [Nostoc sp. NMS7]|uniref:Gfo/Idh/MocA family protein n=1 Tax=Nostoc sp. NMS7 TaxID=2815391 RepID=UPI0025DA1D07|nr:Gfo/Idh/MocA family oxidoreductase [Nostoc sp. NMS7]
MSNENIRVGIIGAGGWAKYGHIPALQYLEDFEIIAVSSRKKETAEEYAAKFNILHAFGDEQALINHPDVDIVVILAPAPEHARHAKAAIAAGKDVYSEWPLTTKTSESEELLSLAEAKGVRHIVGPKHGTERSLHARPREAGIRGEDSICSHDGERGCFRAHHIGQTRVGNSCRQLFSRPFHLRGSLYGCAVSLRRVPEKADCGCRESFPILHR